MATSRAAAPAIRRGHFDHPGLLYRDTGEYLAGTTGFVRAAVAAGDPVLVAVPGSNLELLRGALADVADRVRFADMAVAGRNPGRIIPGVLLAFAAAIPNVVFGSSASRSGPAAPRSSIRPAPHTRR
jgi:hypothetical protein